MHVTAGLLTYGDAPNSHIQLNVVLQYVQTDPLALAAGAVEAQPWPSTCTERGEWPAGDDTVHAGPAPASSPASCAVWVAVGSGVAAYDEKNVVMHVVQHVLLMMVAAPLIVLGKPLTLATQAACRANQVCIIKVLHSRAVAALTFPVLTWFLYYEVCQARLRAEQSDQAAARLGISPEREGWTIAAWRLAQIQAQQARCRPSRSDRPRSGHRMTPPAPIGLFTGPIATKRLGSRRPAAERQSVRADTRQTIR